VSQLYKTAPVGAVWDYYCAKKNVGVGKEWLDAVKKYEKETLSLRK
jgi:L-rhamnose isomerase